MNQAKYKDSGEIIEAEDLRYLSDPKSIEFVCATQTLQKSVL
jgi:hypothetical protein